MSRTPVLSSFVTGCKATTCCETQKGIMKWFLKVYRTFLTWKLLSNIVSSVNLVISPCRLTWTPCWMYYLISYLVISLCVWSLRRSSSINAQEKSRGFFPSLTFCLINDHSNLFSLLFKVSPIVFILFSNSFSAKKGLSRYE